MAEEETTLNQDQGIFSDEEAADLLNYEEDTEKPEQEAAPEEAQTEQEQLFSIKYNGKEEQLTLQQMTELAQKGRNYDHVKGELDSYRNGNVYKAFKRYADKNNMSMEDYAQMLNDQEEASAQAAAENELKEQYPDAPDALIRELAERRTKTERADAKTKAEAAEAADWAAMVEQYPDWNADNIPEDILEAVQKGKKPLEAARDFELAQLRERVHSYETGAQRQNELNKQRSTGSLKGDVPKTTDPFLEGLFSV